MGSTKIINVLKDDQFEDILDAFQKAEAEEMIFIFPKNTKVGKKEAHFASLAKEAKNSQKQVTIMTADQNIERYADKYGFRFLAQQSKTKKIVSPKIDEPEEKPQGQESGDDEDWAANEDSPLENEDQEEDVVADSVLSTDSGQAELTMARATTPRKSASRSADKKVQKLESIWLKRESSERPLKKSASNFWSGFNLIKKRPSRNFNLIFLASAALVLLIVLFTFLGSAQVILKPQKQKLDFELPVTVSANAAEIDLNRNQIPGQFLSFKADVSKDFPTTGEKEVVKKARGEIMVFNNYNSDPQNLVATTRFESSKGLIFRIPRPITIPEAKLVNSKLIPGSTTVEVIADKPGPEYNINADRFSIPGFANNTPKFEGFYAESSKPMSGGTIGLSPIVTEQDFNSAKEAVTKEVLNQSLNGLKSKTNNLEIVDPAKNEVTSLKSTVEIDDSAEGFAMSASAEAKSIGFLKKDLLQIIEAFINKNGNLVLLKETVNVEYKNVKFDFSAKGEESSTLTFTAAVKGEAATKLEENKIVEGLLGLKQDQIKDYLLSFKEIESARVILSPFWVKTVPKNNKEVHVKIVY